MVQFFAFGSQFGALFLLPLLLQTERGLSPLQSGLTTFPQAIGIISIAPLAGRIYGFLGPRRMTVAGLTLAGVASLSLIAMQTATFASVPRESMGRGSAIYSVTRQVRLRRLRVRA